MSDKTSLMSRARGALVPPAVSAWAASRSKHATQFTEVASWDQAVAESTGYTHSTILDRVDAATRQVIAGHAAYERDGFLFSEPDYRWQLATALLRAHARDGYLRVVDFGGSLGSVYWQHRNLLPTSGVEWTVVEQPHFVERGKALPTTAISFSDNLSAALAAQPNVVILSSVLQYMADPLQVIDQVVDSSPGSVVIDRTPMHGGLTNIPTIQRVPPHIYSGSYPAWILSQSQLAHRLEPRGKAIWFPGIEPDGRTRQGTPFQWQGLWS